jgi:ArsR family transcriptional regulator, arsenate/arsenite/antimonite-responsive transcriptional repressor
MKRLSIKELEKKVKATADLNRIRILRMLSYRKMCVCEIAFVLGIAQPSVSRHLKKLKASGFIESENAGMWTNYYLCPQNVYAKNFIKNLGEWIDPQGLISKDKDMLDKADRDKLCFSKACP